MLPPAAAPQDVVDAIAKIEALLDDVVNHGNDDELFIASYLQGHFAVEARQLEMVEVASLSMLNDKMTDSLQRAFDNNELDAQDAELVKALWNRLFEGASKLCTN
ncbi:MAG: YfcL family protein [Pseudomonadota bacterium]|nr:YfcL family protein [Pseudomonadota bacterium]